MNYKLIKSPSNGIWVFIDGKHKKTIPSRYLTDFEKLKDKLDYNKKRLFPSERECFENLGANFLIQNFKDDLKANDIHLFRAIENCSAIGVRFVNSKNCDRYEMKFDNGMFLKIPKKLYSIFPEKLDVAFLNY